MNDIKISFVGDVSLNDNYINYYNEHKNPFKVLELYLNKKDFVFGNLECISKGEYGENILKKPRLTTTVNTLNFLNNINLKVACLAQNHVYDHLEDGFIKTIRFLEKNNIKYLGAGITKEESEKELIIEKYGVKIGILNYVTNDTNPNLPENAKVYLNLFDKHKVIVDIINLKLKVDHVVVQLHWGGRVEGGLFPDFYQPEMAKDLIDNGADLIIGHHSHTFQPFEIYKGKYVFYSLGNFCFSDFYFEGKFYPMPKRRNITSIVEISFTKENYNVAINFFENHGLRFKKLNKYIYKAYFRNFIFKIFLRKRFFWNIYYFNKKYLINFIIFVQRSDINIFIKSKRIINSIMRRIN